jgi:hypothetical protein
LSALPLAERQREDGFFFFFFFVSFIFHTFCANKYASVLLWERFVEKGDGCVRQGWLTKKKSGEEEERGEESQFEILSYENGDCSNCYSQRMLRKKDTVREKMDRKEKKTTEGDGRRKKKGK